MKHFLSNTARILALLLVLSTTSLIAAQDVELTLWVYDDGRLEILTELGAEFEAEFGVPVLVEVVDLTEIRNAMTLGAASGEGPDMIIIPHDKIGRAHV